MLKRLPCVVRPVVARATPNRSITSATSAMIGCLVIGEVSGSYGNKQRTWMNKQRYCELQENGMLLRREEGVLYSPTGPLGLVYVNGKQHLGPERWLHGCLVPRSGDTSKDELSFDLSRNSGGALATVSSEMDIHGFSNASRKEKASNAICISAFLCAAVLGGLETVVL
jgi:hypothetical protein